MTARCAEPVVAIYSRITLLCYRVECHQLICIISAADVIIASLIRYGAADGSSTAAARSFMYTLVHMRLAARECIPRYALRPPSPPPPPPTAPIIIAKASWPAIIASDSRLSSCWRPSATLRAISRPRHENNYCILIVRTRESCIDQRSGLSN